jgi:hypothetical protein
MRKNNTNVPYTWYKPLKTGVVVVVMTGVEMG